MSETFPQDATFIRKRFERAGLGNEGIGSIERRPAVVDGAVDRFRLGAISAAIDGSSAFCC